LKITFLGTGTSQGVPIIACDCEVCSSNDERDKRLRSSVLIESEETKITIDCGPDFRYQMLRENIKNLDGIVFTHGHRDHTAGLDDIRAFNFIQKKDMDIFVTEATLSMLKRQYEYIFEEHKYPGIPKLNTHQFGNAPFHINDLKLIPILVYHYRMPVFGFRIKDFTYITDANFIDEEEKNKIRGTKVLVLNALRKEKHISHFTLDEAIELVEELKPEQAYFTHISHQLGLHNEVERNLPKNIKLAYDKLTIEI